MNKCIPFLISIFPAIALGQQSFNGIPNQGIGLSGTGAPLTTSCNLNDYYNQTDAAAGANIWICTIANVQWTNESLGTLSFVNPGLAALAPTAAYNMATAGVSGSQLTDQTANANHATLVASPTVTSAHIAFNGTTQKVTLPSALTNAKSMLYCTDVNYLKESTFGSFHAIIGSTTASDWGILQSTASNYDISPAVYWSAQGNFNTKAAVGIGPNTGGMCLGYSSDATADKFYINGVQVSNYQAQTATFSLSRTGPLELMTNQAGFWTLGNGFYFMAWTSEQTDNVMKQAYAYALAQMTANGVPFTYSSGSNNNTLLEVGDSMSVSGNSMWTSLLSTTKTYTVYPINQSGMLSSWLMSALPAVAAAAYPSGAGSFATIVDLSGTNDCAIGQTGVNTTPIQTVAEKVATAKLLRPLGWRWIEVTGISRTGTSNGYYGLSNDACMQDLNALLRANASAFDVLVDMSAFARTHQAFDMTAPGAYINRTYFQSDGIHPTTGATAPSGGGPSGSQLFATAIGEAINTLDAPATPAGATMNPQYMQSQIQVAHAVYDFTIDGGSTVTPALTSVIPSTALIIGATVESTVAVTAAGSATVSIGTTAGSSASSILAATGKATLALNALVNGVPTLAAPVRMTASGSINFTVATGPLTAGVIEVFVYYVLPRS